MKRDDFRLVHRLRVRWAEVDMQKIVFNAHYLAYFDLAISDYWRALVLPYEDAMARLSGELYLKKVAFQYHESACLDDQLEVGLKCGRIGTSSMRFAGGIFRGERLLADGELIYVFADPATQRPTRVPQALRQLAERFEAGEPVYDIQVGDWTALGPEASTVRTAVFVREQGVPQEMEWDAHDADSLHVVARNALGQAVGTARLLAQANGAGRIGRMAVHRALRGTGVGQTLLQALLAVARSRGDAEAFLHAQRSAEKFYLRQGFKARGEPFEEAGISHIEMAIKL